MEPSVASLFLAPCVHHDFTKGPGGNEGIGGSSGGSQALGQLLMAESWCRGAPSTAEEMGGL